MKSLVTWLQRLSEVTPEEGLAINWFRVTVPGDQPLDITDWLLSIDPQGSLAHDMRATCPESWSVIRVPDLPGRETNLHDRHRFSYDLACLLSLALDRKVVIPIDFAVSIPGLNNVTFLPVSQVVDQGIIGPLPTDSTIRLTAFLTAVVGLSDKDQEQIGAAASAYHGALLLFDREPRAAYALLVAGIEALSQWYGTPPTEWKDWDESSKWEAFFSEQGLMESQVSSFQNRLMQDKHIKLGETFRNYASSRLGDDFWQKPLDRWIYGVDANTGQQLPAQNMQGDHVIDVLPQDRTYLKKMLNKSYELRSGVVHSANWVELMTLAPPPSPPLGANRPLPFPILRLILAELIWLELSSRSKPSQLPDFKLLREQKSDI